VPERHSFDPQVWPVLRRLIRERGIDIVHAHDYKTDLLALLLALRDGVVPLSTVHGWSGFSPREARLYYPADRWLLRWFPRVIAVSNTIAEILVQSGVDARRVVTVSNGIDPGVFRRQHDAREVRAELQLPAAAPVIGAVGRLEIEKRFDILIDAMPFVRERHPGAVLVLAGSGTLEADLKARAAVLGLADACVFLGQRTDVPRVLHALDVFVQSSDTEGTPNAVLEAMALETPVVATDVGGTRDLMSPDVHGLLVPRRDPAALAAAIGSTLADPETTAARVAAARRRVETELSFDARMDKVERIYDELAAGRGTATGKAESWVPVRAKQ
jgi:glycosyltransferase involved in cell wall biosynthesis